MRMKPFPAKDGKRVWLSDEETDALIDKMQELGGTRHTVGVRLGVHCGLRRDEASQTRSADLATDLGERNLRVWEDAAKLDKYRETPIPADLARDIERIVEFSDDVDRDDSVLQVTGKTLNRWVQRAAAELHEETDDEGWLELSYHDLRRTWGTRALEQGALPTVIMEWGGWEDWETFRTHYCGELSPHALKRERSKLTWMGGDIEQATIEDHLTPVAQPHATSAQHTR